MQFPTRTLLIALAIAAGTAQAAPVTYQFAGTLSYASPDLGPQLSAGNAFNGTFTFESTTPDSDATPSHGTYAAPPEFAVTVNGLSYSLSNALAGGVVITDAPPNGILVDNLTVNSGHGQVTGPVVLGYSLNGFILLFQDDHGLALSSDDLPVTGIDLALFNFSLFEIAFQNPDTGELIPVYGGLTSIRLVDQIESSVPEPGSLPLLGLGLGLACAIAFRRRRK